MALRHLVEGECGAANPLVQWTSHFTQEKSMLKGGLDQDRLAELSGHRENQADQMVNEFLGQPAIPQTFHMGSLLHQVQQTSPDVSEWVNEFSLPGPSAAVPTTSDSWVKEFEALPPAEAKQWSGEAEQWAEEFEKESARGVAKELSEKVTDPEIQATEFMDFVRKMAAGEVTVDKQHETGESWTEQFERESKSGSGGYWAQLEREWEDLSKAETHPWLSEFESGELSHDYAFQEDNPLREVSNPLEEGLKRREEGDLPTAVLLFEAEVQARPDSVKGWLLLGITQADNEQDIAAIAALHKCLSLEPSNLDAHLALAVSYTNESQQTKALEALREWIQHNPKYAELAHLHSPQREKSFTGSFMTREEHASVRDLYLAAAQISPDQMDYHVQVGLGVLFNLSHEYDKAVDCFSAALDTRPNDAMLWNKLGATLANGNRSEEAVSAYRKALEIMPGFTRCRYNLGVSCINLGAHKEAVEHLLTALNMQRQARGPQGSKSQMSESIWSTLRLAVTFVGRQTEVHRLLEQRDLDSLMREFGV